MATLSSPTMNVRDTPTSLPTDPHSDNIMMKRQDTNSSSSSSFFHNNNSSHNNNNNNSNNNQKFVFDKSTDETLSTVNCDDSMTASVATSVSPSRLYGPPPVAAVNVDTRGVRQRLREQEAKITALLHSNNKASARASSENVLLKLVKTLEEDLKKTKDEKESLQEALEQLRLTQQQQQEQQKKLEEAVVKEKQEEAQVETPETGSTVTTITTTTPTTDEDNQRIKTLESELRLKTFEISLMHERWETTLRRMVQYQCDLELHDLHYTDYAAQQMAAGQAALQELRDLTAKHQPTETRQLGKKAKHMMSTLLQDLEVLGERYQESRVAQEQEVAKLQQEQAQWQRRCQVLEGKLQKQQHEVDDDDDDDDDEDELQESPNSTMSGPLMKFHEKMRLQQAAALQSQEQLQVQLVAAQWEKEQANTEKEVLLLEVDRLQQTVSQLQQVVTQQHQEAATAQAQAAAQQQQLQEQEAALQQLLDEKSKSQKKFRLFGSKKKKEKTASVPRPASTPVVPPPVVVDLESALAPMQGESRRFDMLQERFQAQMQAITAIQDDLIVTRRKKAQLEQTVADLRLTQEQATAQQESDALLELRAQMTELEAQREQEQKQAQAAIQALQARLAALTTVKKD